ncbi:MAG: hypothetical protein WCR72_14940 [Bacteroidota bacterium]
MEHKIWFEEEHQLLHIQIHGELSTEDSQYMGNKAIELLDGKPYRQLIIDLSKFNNIISRETRSRANELLNIAGITDVGFVGANAAGRMLAKVLMKLGSLKAESDFFKSFEEATNWLEKRRKK